MHLKDTDESKKIEDVKFILVICTGFYLIWMLFIWGAQGESSMKADTYGYEANPASYWGAMALWNGIGVIIPVTVTALMLYIKKETPIQKTWHMPATLWGFWGTTTAICLLLSS